MPVKWSTISLDPRYEQLSAEDKRTVQDRFWAQTIAADPSYQARTPEEQGNIRTRFWATARDIPQTGTTHALYDDPEGISSRMSYLRRVYITERRGSIPHKDKYFNELPREYQRDFLGQWNPAIARLPDEDQTRLLDRIGQEWNTYVKALEESAKKGIPTIGATVLPPEFEERRGIAREIPAALGAALAGVPQRFLSSTQALAELALPDFGRPYDRQAAWTRHDWTEPNFWRDLAEENEYLRPTGLQRIDYTRPLGQKIRDPRWWIRSGAQVTTQIGLGIASHVTAGPLAAFGFVASQEGGAAFDAAIQEGADEQTAAREALAVGAINGMLEFLPLDRIATRFGSSALNKVKRTAIARARRIIAEGVKQGAYEGVTEGLQETVQWAAAKLGHGSDVTFAENTDQVLEAMLLGGTFGALFGGGAQVVLETQLPSEAKERQQASETLNLPPDATPEAVEARYQEVIRTAEAAPAADPEAAQTQMRDVIAAAQAREVLTKGKPIPPPPAPEARPPMRLKAFPLSEKEISAVFKWYKAGLTGTATVTPSRLLDYAIKHEAKGVRAGYRAGQIDLNATHAEIVAYAKEYLPPSESRLAEIALLRTKISTKTLEKTLKVRTPSEVKQVVKAINKMVANYESASLVIEYKDAVKRLKRLKLRPEFQATVDALTDTFRLTETRASTKAKFESILRAAKLDVIGEIPGKLIDKAERVLADAEKPLLRDMEPDDIRSITQAVLTVAQQNVLKNQLLASKKHRDAEKAITDTTETIKDIHGEKITKVTPRKPAIHIVAGAQLSHDTDVAHLVGEEGAGREILYDNLQDAHGDYIAIRHEAQEDVVAALQEADISRKLLRQWSAAIRGKPVAAANMVTVELPTATTVEGTRVPNVTLTVAERMELINFLRDPNNRAALIRNKQQGITLDRDPLLQPIRLGAADIQAIRESASPDELVISEAMWRYVNGPLRNAVNRTSVAEIGIEIWPRTEHWPRRRDAEFITTEPDAMIKDFTLTLFEHFGIFKPRVGGVTPFRIGDVFRTYNTHVTKAAAYAAKTKAVHDAIRLLKDRRFRQQVLRSVPHGEDVLRDLEKTIRAYVGTDIIPVGDVERVVRAFIRRAHIGVLALKPAIIAYQKVSLLNAVVEIEAKYIVRAMIPAPKQTQAEIKAYSPQLWARTSSSGHQIFTPGTEGTSLQEFYVPSHKSAEALFMLPITASDAGVIHTLWRAARAKMIDQGFTGEELMQQTAKLAEQIVERTQPTWDPLTISQLAEAGKFNVFVKLLATMFSSQRSKNTNMAVRGWHRWQRSNKTFADFTQLTKSLVIPFGVNAVAIHAIGFGVRQGWEALWGIEDEDEPEHAWLQHVEGILRRAFGNWLIVGDLFSELQIVALRKILRQPGRIGELHRNLLAQTAEDMVFMVAHLAEAIAKGVEDDTEGSQAELISAAERAVNVISIALGLPLQGLMQPVRPAIREKKKELKEERR